MKENNEISKTTRTGDVFDQKYSIGVKVTDLYQIREEKKQIMQQMNK